VVKQLEALELAVLIDKVVVQTSRILAELPPDLYDHLPEERLLGFVFTFFSRGDNVGVSRDVSVGADEEAGAEGDQRNVERLSLVSRWLKQDLTSGAVDNTHHCGLAVHREPLAIIDGLYDVRALRGKQCSDYEESAGCSKKQSAHKEGSLGMMV
jgi:hypothetical protein